MQRRPVAPDFSRFLRRALFCLGAALLASAPARAAETRYDVLYLWHASLPQAQQRRQSVAALLGRRVARNLRVISADGAYGVAYLRQGDARSARVTAASHSRRLQRKGLGKAWAAAERPWALVDAPDAPQAVAVAAKAAPVKAAAPKKAAEPAPVEEDKAVAEAQASTETKTDATPAADAKTPAAPQTAAVRSVVRGQLEAMLDEHVKELRRQGRLASDERTAWSVYDITTNETLVEINADLELQTASLVKPFLALAFMSQVDKKKLVYDDESRRQMTRMIQISDNASADWVMRRLGGPVAVQRQLKEEFGSMLTGVEIKEYIPASGRTYRNRATARDYSRFLLALWRDEVPGSQEIKRLMALPKRDRLRTGVPLPADIAVYDKTGSTSRLCGDIGVLSVKGPDGKEYSYTLVGIIEKASSARNYLSWMRSRGNVIRYVSYMVYRSVGAIHGFAAAQ